MTVRGPCQEKTDLNCLFENERTYAGSEVGGVLVVRTPMVNDLPLS